VAEGAAITDIGTIPGLRRSRRVWPLFAALALFGFAAAAGALVIFLLNRGPDVRASVVQTEAGERLRVEVPSAPEGTRVRVAGQEALLVSGVADLPLAADALHLGDNPLAIAVVQPGGGVDEVEVVLSVSYRVRPDLSGLVADTPHLSVVVDVAPGASVTLDGQPVTLDAQGHASVDFPVDADAQVARLERSFRYRVVPLDGPPADGEIRVALPFAQLQIDRPGLRLVTDKARVELAGLVAAGATLSLDGENVEVREGRFVRTLELPALGERSFVLLARQPGHAPRRVEIKIQRVADMSAEARGYDVDTSLRAHRPEPEHLSRPPRRLRGSHLQRARGGGAQRSAAARAPLPEGPPLPAVGELSRGHGRGPRRLGAGPWGGRRGATIQSRVGRDHARAQARSGLRAAGAPMTDEPEEPPTRRVVEGAQTLDIPTCGVCGRRNAPDARFCGGCGQPVVGDPDISEPGDAPGVADPLVGRVIAERYRILSLLGRGGMGVVYLVEHVHIGKRMAMKLLHGELARNRDTIKRFRREAEAASKLTHPNTVQVFDFGNAEGLMYLVMELVEGRDLSEILRDQGALDFREVARLGVQVCASLSEAHKLGIVHRDLKPENVMVTQLADGKQRAKVLDFGLAKLRDSKESVTVTRAGAIIGTPYYMSPEQIRGEPVDPRGDVYSIGAMLYKACTGVPPFAGTTPMGVLTKHLTEELVPPSQRTSRSIPPEADQIIGMAMAKNRDDRFQSADELRVALLDFLASVGDDVDDSLLRSSVARQAIKRADGVVSTREAVDRYERALHRRGLFGYIALVLLLVGLGVGGVYFWRRPSAEQDPSVEHEPNDQPEQAAVLPEGLSVTGFLGRRSSTTIGDVDLYELRNTGGRHVLSAELTGIPNIDLVLDVFRPGQAEPVLSVDTGSVGEGERIPNFPIRGRGYLLRVREHWVTGRFPTENISDSYSLRWSFIEPGPEDESEVNDSLALANELGIGERRRGYIGWSGDVDTYCLSGDPGTLRARLSGVADLDLVLQVVDRDHGRSVRVDDHGPSEGEDSDVIEDARAGRICFEVSAKSSGEGIGAGNAATAYVLSLEAAESPTGEPETP